MHLVHIGWSSVYELVAATFELSSRRGLRSASSQQHEVPRTTLKFVERALSFAGPTACLIYLIYRTLVFSIKKLNPRTADRIL